MRKRTGINISLIPAALITYAVLVLCPFSSAYANYQDVESYSYDFLVETANAADVTPNEFVFNYIFTSNVITGQNLTDETGMSLEEDVETNLSHMKETEEYPNWENLPQEWKNRWGTPKDYYASKFNHLYATGSGGRGYETDLTQFEGSGGDDFSWTDTVYDNLVDLGRKFKKFLLGDANSVAEVLENFIPDAKNSIVTYMASPNYTMFDASSIGEWPAGVPTRIPVSSTNLVTAIRNSDNATFGVATNIQTYRFAALVEGNVFPTIVTFSENQYRYYAGRISEPITYNGNPTTISVNINGENKNYYWYAYTASSLDISSLNIPYFSVTSWDIGTSKLVAKLILFSGQNIDNPTSVPIVDYPEVLQTNVNIYMPDNVSDSTAWLDYITPGSSNPGTGTDLSTVLALLRRIETQLGLLDSTSEDLNTLETAIAQFKFYTGGILKVHDEGLFDSLTDIGSDIHDILTTLTLWPKGDAPDAPDIIGDFDFAELQDKSDLLLESVSDLAPFGALLLMSEMVGILSQTGNLEEPEFVIPFQFMPGHSYDVTIDLSWLEDGRVYINFFCILSLILCLLNVTIRIIELEAAS